MNRVPRKYHLIAIKLLKTKPQRSDLIIVGAGLAGICAAIAASREGLTVSLLERKNHLGGRLGPETRTPFDFAHLFNFPFCRESGLLDEFLANLQNENPEGTPCGFSRSLLGWISAEKRINLHFSQSVAEAKLNSNGDRIESVLTLSEFSGERTLFRAPYFIDCSGSGILARLAGISGEYTEDRTESVADSSPGSKRAFKAAALINISEAVQPTPFSCPAGINIKWEDNLVAARLDWMESLSQSLTGFHHLEWNSSSVPHSPSAEEITWAAWDYLKNRSPLVKTVENLKVESISPINSYQNEFRGLGEYFLDYNDVLEGKSFLDSVALCRAPMSSDKSLFFSNHNKLVLPHPFEIPLRCLISKEVKNLFWAGEHASCSAPVARCLSHPPTSAQLGEAVGVSAALCLQKKRLPRTLCKPGHIQELRARLEQTNHRTGIEPPCFENDLVPDSKVSASSTLRKFHTDGENEQDILGPLTHSALLQIPIETDHLDKIRILLDISSPATIEVRLLEGSSYLQSIPGHCLEASEILPNQSGIQWVQFDPNCRINNPGWHFLEIKSSSTFRVCEQECPPVGILSMYPRKLLQIGGNNPYSVYTHHLVTDSASVRGPQLVISPEQNLYSPSEIATSPSTATNLPNLWISEPTDFKYPEFLEFKWQSPVEISTICLHFDSTPENLFIGYPKSYNPSPMPAVISSYRIYGTDPSGKTFKILENSKNHLPFVSHSFPTVSILSLEFEMIATQGAKRAQIYKVCAFA
jgi:hypothetical protein